MSEQLPDGIREIAAGQVERLADVVAGLSDADLVAPTLCAGWLVAHLLVHMRLGFAEQATSFAEPAGPQDAVDRDYVSYWRDWPPAVEPVTYGQARFYWATGSAYASADGLRQALRRHRAAGGGDEQAGAGRDFPAAGARHGRRGHPGDVDRRVGDPPARPDRAPARRPAGTAAGRAHPRAAHPRRPHRHPGPPAGWTPERYLLKGTGRLPLDDAEREFLGEHAAAFPALG